MATQQTLATTPRRTAIINVRVFDGQSLTAPTTVLIEDGLIADGPTDDVRTLDGAGGTLLPGLVDTHVHVDDRADLVAARRWGVTTVLDMGTPAPARIVALRGLEGLPDLRSAGVVASGPGGLQTTRMGYPSESALQSDDQAEEFVRARVAEGSAYCKIIVEDPARMGPAALDQTVVAALVTASRRVGLLSVAHVTTPAAVQIAVHAGVDVITHAPLAGDLPAALVLQLAADGRICIPTLTMMQGIAASPTPRPGPSLDYAHARSNVAALHAAGVPVLAGTDANSSPGAPARVPHGESLHCELALLVDAGLSPVEALRAATELPARHFGLPDRGAVHPGLRADLLLVDGDPTQDITATRAVRAVWCAGVQHLPSDDEARAGAAS